MKWRIQLREYDKARLFIECPHGVNHGREVLECERSLWRSPPIATGNPPKATMWQWDGSVDRPTIAPSIDCQGGCGRHFTMTAGVPSPDTP